MSSILFLMHFGSNTGYAIEPLERLFYGVGLVIGGDNPRNIHFGYPNVDDGPSKSLPEGFNNILVFDFKNISPENLLVCGDYCRKNNIDYVVIFDIQPVHPLFRVLRRFGVKTIVSYIGSEISSLMPWWKLIIKKAEVKFSRSKVDGLIFESRAMADLATRGRGTPESMIDIIPLGVDIEKYRPGKSHYAHDLFGFSRDKKIIFYSGHMHRGKGVYIIIEAAIELLTQRNRKDVCFLLVGNKGDQSKQYEQMYAGMGIDKDIVFGGYRSDMPQLYQSCYCGTIASTGFDSFTMTSVEMAASGLPVVASRLQGLAEAVVDGQTGFLFEPGNSRMLADKLEYLLDNPEINDKYGRQGRIRCEKELNTTVQKSRFVEALLKR